MKSEAAESEAPGKPPSRGRPWTGVHWIKSAVVILLCGGCLAGTATCSKRSKEAPSRPSFDGPSERLGATDVIPTLDTPIPEGHNAIWCASFQAAWKALCERQGNIGAMGAASGQLHRSLNEAPDPRPEIPEACLYVAAGSVTEGIIGRIQKELGERFPGKALPSFEGVGANSMVAYAYIEATVDFPELYDENPAPFSFGSGPEVQAQVRSFGIVSGLHKGRDKVLRQPYILFQTGDPTSAGFEFAVDLCSNSSPSQIVVARIKREPTLSAALRRVEMESTDMERRVEAGDSFRGHPPHALLSIDSLLLPEMYWSIAHHLKELEGKGLSESGPKLDVALQDIRFRLNRAGATLESEGTGAFSAIPRDFNFNRPYLIYMTKRNARQPYFVMWVENAELLCGWERKGR